MQKALVVILLSLHAGDGRDPETQDQSAGIVCNFNTCWETKGLRTTFKKKNNQNQTTNKPKQKAKTHTQTNKTK